MLDFLINIFSFFYSIWKGLPESVKDDVITASTDVFDDVFRKFYQSEKGVA